jgi:hypothetical protein
MRKYWQLCRVVVFLWVLAACSQQSEDKCQFEPGQTWIAKDIGALMLEKEGMLHLQPTFAPGRSVESKYSLDKDTLIIKGHDFFCPARDPGCVLQFKVESVSSDQKKLVPVNTFAKKAFANATKIFQCKAAFSQAEAWDSLYVAHYLPGKDTLHLFRSGWLKADGQWRAKEFYRGQVSTATEIQLEATFWEKLNADIERIDASNFDLLQTNSQDATIILVRLYRNNTYFEKEGIQPPSYFSHLSSFLINGFPSKK